MRGVDIYYDGKYGAVMARKKTRARMGRPPKPPAERRDQVVSVSLTKAERRRIVAAARAAGITVAELLMRPWRREGRR